MKKIEIDAFEYDELVGGAKERARTDMINFWLETPQIVPEDVQDSYNKAVQRAEELQTPWFVHGYIWDYCKDALENELREGFYFQNGEFIDWKANVE